MLGDAFPTWMAVRVFDDYFRLLVSRAEKGKKEDDLLSLDPEQLKSIELMRLLHCTFTTLRLAHKIDEQLITEITKRVKGFNNRIVVLFYLLPII
jgi:hypothetical protein